MDRSTVLLKTLKTCAFLSAAALMLMTVSPAGAATLTYNDSAMFQGAVQSGYLETFNGATPGQVLGPVQFSSGAYHYSVDVPGDSIFFIESTATAGDFALSTSSSDFDILFTFGSGINAVGGNFFATDAPGNVIAGTLTLTLSDGTVQTLTNPAGTDFSGFISGSDISSLRVSTDGTGIFGTVDNLYVGTAAASAAPEPQSVFLLLGTLGVGLLQWRRSQPNRRA
jgi:hypothetical protein